MSTVVAFAPEVERVLAFKTVREGHALAAFLAAVRQAGRDEAEFTIERLHELLALAEHFQALLLYDQVEFLRTPGNPESDREFATSVQRVNLEAANGFQRFLRSRAAWATTADSLELAHRVTGLALDAIHGLMKWGYFLGEPARSAPWRQLHALYALADADGVARAPFLLHPAQENFKPTVQSLYLRTLVLDLLNAGNLSRAQIEIADGWFSSWCQEYSLDTEFVPGKHLFYVDLDSPGGMRLLRGDTPGDSARYLGADALKAQIEDVQSGLRHGRLYAGYGSGALFPVEEHVALLATIEKLHQSVLSGNESRIEERTHFEDREVDVVCGTERVMRRVREGAPRASTAGTISTADLTQTIEITPAGLSLVSSQPAPEMPPHADPCDGDPELERWRVHDLSSRGYGLVIDTPPRTPCSSTASWRCSTRRPAAGSSAAWCASARAACAEKSSSAWRCSPTARSRSSSHRSTGANRPRPSTCPEGIPAASTTRWWLVRAGSTRAARSRSGRRTGSFACA